MFKKWITATIAGVLLSVGGPAWAADYPNRPVKVVVPFPPGGATDVAGRLVAERLQNAFGKPFVVENRSGASGNIGVGEVVRSPADGYTLVVGAPQTLTINPLLFSNIPFDPKKDLDPIVMVASVPNVLIVNKDLPVNSVPELIQYIKDNPGKVRYGSSSVGGTPHLSSEMFASMTGTKIAHIPYRGSAPALQDLLGGHIEMMFDNLPASLPQIRAGTVKALAVTTLERSKSAPDIPTLDEQGVKGFESQGWFSLLAPAGTDPTIVERINGVVNEALQDPEFRARLASVGADPVGGSSEDFRNAIQAESKRWAKVIQEAGIKVE
ncbi:Bug family tripartite tricarboxylate transporter substrate binding protein [Bordetella sp. 02P26C-1]|uniref:Bug family tripartite tricarboxylate transporter substrate binding protein n=1 Tax=Bordetella sp. 02P26C-1 TaxID=2683195 RepID=UPI0013549ACA|nr:tripartite tricarboxylate transporter substrate binding protein [Bordetella sp. 02P26C-1]MVW78477.1 tripartite tricarboxylate transporter substrate binding protein [Bordetella sp. 02P26C-1]